MWSKVKGGIRWRSRATNACTSVAWVTLNGDHVWKASLTSFIPKVALQLVALTTHREGFLQRESHFQKKSSYKFVSLILRPWYPKKWGKDRSSLATSFVETHGDKRAAAKAARNPNMTFVAVLRGMLCLQIIVVVVFFKSPFWFHGCPYN